MNKKLLKILDLEKRKEYRLLIKFLFRNRNKIKNKIAYKNYLNYILKKFSYPMNRFNLAELITIIIIFFSFLFFVSLFMVDFFHFISNENNFDYLSKILGNKSNKIEKIRPMTKDELLAEKLLSKDLKEILKKRDGEPIVIEESFFDRYPHFYFKEGSDKNFLRLIKNMNLFTIEDKKEHINLLIDRLKKIDDPYFIYRYNYEIALAYYIHLEDNISAKKYINKALDIKIEEIIKIDANYLLADIYFNEAKYEESRKALLPALKDSKNINAHILLVMIDFFMINRYSLSDYLELNERFLKILGKINNDIYMLEVIYNQFEEIRDKSDDPIILFFQGELLYSMGNIKKAKKYFSKYIEMEKRTNFISYKISAKKMI